MSSPAPDALFELSDAVLCVDGPVTSLVGLSLAAEHRRGHGALYDAVNSGVIEVDRLRRALAGLPLPRDREGRIVLAVVVGRLRSDRVLHLPAPAEVAGQVGRPRRHGDVLDLADPAGHSTPTVATVTQTGRYGAAFADAWDRAHPA